MPKTHPDRFWALAPEGSLSRGFGAAKEESVPQRLKPSFCGQSYGTAEAVPLTRRSITGDTALRLAHFFGMSAEFWLNLQSLYEIRLAEKKSGKTIRALPTIKDMQAA